MVFSRGQNRKLLQACGLWLRIYETSPPLRNWKDITRDLSVLGKGLVTNALNVARILRN